MRERECVEKKSLKKEILAVYTDEYPVCDTAELDILVP